MKSFSPIFVDIYIYMFQGRPMAMVLRSIYLDPTLDAELASRAEVEGTTKAELMRRFLIAGLARPAARFSGYATEALSAHTQGDVAHAAEPRVAYTAESAAASEAEPGIEYQRYGAALAEVSKHLAEQRDELEVNLLLGEEDIATSAPGEELAARAPAAPPARVARGTQRPRTAERGRGDTTHARAEQPQRTASQVPTRGNAATAHARGSAPRKPHEP
jgi:hypothetical protein